jgi:hypothetical protein
MSVNSSSPDEDRDVILIDESNSIVTRNRPASASIRKLIRDELAKEKLFLDRKEEMNGKGEQQEGER